jgi:mono/diheme cytochrome c family protein
MGNTRGTPLPRTGVLAALDMTTNTLAWRYRWPEQCYSGTLATGGDLLFVGRNDGRLTAVDSRTGDQLWEFQTGAGMHAPMTTFEHEGRQYVLAYSGGNALIGSPRGDSVWLFGLEGTLPPVDAGTPISRLSNVAPASQAAVASAVSPVVEVAATAAAIQTGRQVYEQTCVVCHGEDGMGGHGGGAPLDKVQGADSVVDIVTNGRNYMPALTALLSAEEIRAVAAYVVAEFGTEAPSAAE